VGEEGVVRAIDSLELRREEEADASEIGGLGREVSVKKW